MRNPSRDETARAFPSTRLEPTRGHHWAQMCNKVKGTLSTAFLHFGQGYDADRGLSWFLGYSVICGYFHYLASPCLCSCRLPWVQGQVRISRWVSPKFCYQSSLILSAFIVHTIYPPHLPRLVVHSQCNLAGDPGVPRRTLSL